MSVEQLVRDAMEATWEKVDLDAVLNGPFELRKHALMTALAASYKHGWDEAEEAFKEALALAQMASTQEHRA